MHEPYEAPAFFAAHPEFDLVVLGYGANRCFVDLEPLGVVARFVAAEEAPDLVAHYLAANRRCFGGPVELPGWVLADLYLLPGVVTLLVDHTESSAPVVAAWCGVPTVEAGVVMGVSLLSLRPGIGAATLVKRLGLAVLRARVQRGVTQWNNPAIRSHTRLGDLRILGPAPQVHGQAERSFVYELTLGEARRLVKRRTPWRDGPECASEAAKGAKRWLVAPGLDGGTLFLAEEPSDREVE